MAVIERTAGSRSDAETLVWSALLGLLAGAVYVALGPRSGTLQFLAIFVLGMVGGFHQRLLKRVCAPRYMFWGILMAVSTAVICLFWPWMGDTGDRHRLQFMYGAAVCCVVALAGMAEWRLRARRGN